MAEMNTEQDYEQVLKLISEDLVDKARHGQITPAFGREKETLKLMRVLTQRKQANPLLVGEPGVGKTAVVENLALTIASGKVPENLINASILEINLPKLNALSVYKGDTEKIILSLVKDIKKATAVYEEQQRNPEISDGEKAGQVFLFIDEIHNAMGGIDKTGTNILEMLKPELSRGVIKIIGATTNKEYQATFGKDDALARRFKIIKVDEPSVEQTIAILRKSKPYIEAEQNVKISDNALVSVAKMTDRYIKDKENPAKSFDVLDTTIANIIVERGSEPIELTQTKNKLDEINLEILALNDETDEVSVKRLNDCLKISTELKQQLQKLEEKYARDKSLVNRNENYKRLIEQMNKAFWNISSKTDAFGRLRENYNLDLARDIKNNVLPKLKKVSEYLSNLVENTSSIKSIVNENAIAEQIHDITNVPVQKLSEDETRKIKEMPLRMSEVVKGQMPAINQLVRMYKIQRVGIGNPNKPTGSYIFMGTTGVGKTELSKVFAEELFGSRSKLKKFDMSEFSDKEAKNRLIGAPPGYTGYEAGGELTNFVRQTPYCILLFDEIEKAHPRVFDIFLQLLDEGRLTDNHGITVDFKNTIVIFTTNIGSDDLKRWNKEEHVPTEEELKETIRNYRNDDGIGFRDEFINRIGKIVAFNVLNDEAYEGIVRKGLKILKTRLMEKNYDFSFTDELVDYIKSQQDEDERINNGARPALDFIDGEIDEKIADLILSKGLKKLIPYEFGYNKKEGIYVRELSDKPKQVNDKELKLENKKAEINAKG